jgi:hypothetical protein
MTQTHATTGDDGSMQVRPEDDEGFSECGDPTEPAADADALSRDGNRTTCTAPPAGGPPSVLVGNAHPLTRRSEQQLAPRELPEAVLDRLVSLLSPDDAALISYGLTPNYGTVVLRRGVGTRTSTEPTATSDEHHNHDATWYHAEIVAGRVIVSADFTVHDDELVGERVSAIAVDSVRRIGIDDKSGAITYLAGDNEITICVEPDVAAAAIRARID